MEETLVTVATYVASFKARFLKDQLEKHDIPCFVTNENVEEEKESRYATRVKVKASMVEKTIEVMFKIRDMFGNEDSLMLKQYTRVLLPIDFSLYSLNACQYALALAAKKPVEINLIHVYEDPSSNANMPWVTNTYKQYLSNVLKENELQANRKMVTFSQELQDQVQIAGIKDVLIDYSLSKGVIYTEVNRLTKIYNPDLLILGLGETTPQAQNQIGISALEIIEQTINPILVLPNSAIYNASDQLRILYATDFFNTDFETLQKLINLLNPFDLVIHCVHIEMGIHRVENEVKLNEIQDKVEKEYNHVNIECHLIESEDLVNGIQEFVDDHKINMITFTTKKRSLIYKLFNPNNLKRMVYQSKLPLLIFH